MKIMRKNMFLLTLAVAADFGLFFTGGKIDWVKYGAFMLFSKFLSTADRALDREFSTTYLTSRTT